MKFQTLMSRAYSALVEPDQKDWRLKGQLNLARAIELDKKKLHGKTPVRVKDGGTLT